MVKILFTEKFVLQFESLPKKIQNLAERKIRLFEQNQKHPSLNVHQLHGPLAKFFSFYIDKSYRVVFEYGSSNTVYFLKIGNHEVYR
jgi:mRNA-degrading endonuclease RelE of RelBE toxin-antitoxin system